MSEGRCPKRQVEGWQCGSRHCTLAAVLRNERTGGGELAAAAGCLPVWQANSALGTAMSVSR